MSAAFSTNDRIACAAVLVARRDDLDDGDDLPASVSNHDAVGPLRVVDPLDPGDHPRGRRSRGDGDPAFRPFLRLAGLKRDDIRNRPPGDLLHHRHVTRRQQPAIQGIPYRHHPALMKIVKITGLDSSPVVNRHGESPQAQPIISFRAATISLDPVE